MIQWQAVEIFKTGVCSSCRSAFLVGGLVLIGLAGNASAAPETFNTALPVAKGEFLFREQFLYKKAGDDPSAADRDLEVLGGISVLGYGVTADLAVFVVLPYLDKDRHGRWRHHVRGAGRSDH